MFIRILYLIISLSSLLSAGPLQAESITEYAVDIVIFEDSEGRYLNSEQWPDETSISPVDIKVENSTTESSLTARLDTMLRPNIRKIDTSKYDLLDSAMKRLSDNKRYQVLVRKSWLQPGLDREQAVDIAIDNTQTANHAQTGSISGTVKIVLERYLHLYTDLSYQRANSTVQVATEIDSSYLSTGQQSEKYIIREHRRMRSKELHYIDHPLVGILIKIVPVETDMPGQRGVKNSNT